MERKTNNYPENCNFQIVEERGKDPTLATNFRPISLLSGFYKLASCVITNRLKKVIPQLIGKQQKAYVPNENIGSVLINLLTTMHIYNEKKNCWINTCY